MAYDGHTKMRQQNKVHLVMHEFKRGTLHSGSTHGPKVTNRDQAIAIAMAASKVRKRAKKLKGAGE